MEKSLCILGCDIDCEEHGIRNSIIECYHLASALIKEQPFHMECKLDDFFVTKYTFGEEKGEVTDLKSWYDSADFYGEEVE